MFMILSLTPRDHVPMDLHHKSKTEKLDNFLLKEMNIFNNVNMTKIILHDF